LTELHHPSTKWRACRRPVERESAAQPAEFDRLMRHERYPLVPASRAARSAASAPTPGRAQNV